MNVKIYIYTYTFAKMKQIFSCVILTHTAAGLSSKLVAVQCTVAIDIDLTRNGREETSVLNSSRFNMFELQMCGFVCLDVSMNPVVYATSKVWPGSIFEAYWTNSHLRQKHVEVVSSCNKNWKGVIKQCISCGVMMNPTKNKSVRKVISRDGSYAESQVTQHVPELMHIDIIRPGQQRQAVPKTSCKILLCFRRDSDM